MTNIIDFKSGKQSEQSKQVDSEDRVTALQSLLAVTTMYSGVNIDDDVDNVNSVEDFGALESFLCITVGEDGRLFVHLFGTSRLEAVGFLELAKLDIISRDPDYEGE